jgi:predicted nucleic acid-binding Zn ribbon protein
VQILLFHEDCNVCTAGIIEEGVMANDVHTNKTVQEEQQGFPLQLKVMLVVIVLFVASVLLKIIGLI